MHEMSLAMEVCRIAEAHVPHERLASVIAVGLEVGDDAGVEPDSLAFWLETLLSSPPFGCAQPRITRVPGDVLRVSYLEVNDGSPND
jgi:Zn finger protein HypA/HybF involved in hydrogenase expression